MKKIEAKLEEQTRDGITEPEDDGLVLASLRRWVAMEPRSAEIVEEEAVRAYEAMASFLLERLCDRFTEVAQVRSFARRMILAIGRDLAAGADPVVGDAMRMFWTGVAEFLDARWARRE